MRATPNIEVRTDTTVVGGGGDGHLQHLVLRAGATGDHETVGADGVFVLIGARPRTDWLPAAVARDAQGLVLTGEDIPRDHPWPLDRRPFGLETSMPRLFAAGDVRKGSIKRLAAAVGDGSAAAQAVDRLFELERAEPDGATKGSVPTPIDGAVTAS
jgi:thioredoxin reductase (NADPH)